VDTLQLHSVFALDHQLQRTLSCKASIARLWLVTAPAMCAGTGQQARISASAQARAAARLFITLVDNHELHRLAIAAVERRDVRDRDALLDRLRREEVDGAEVDVDVHDAVAAAVEERADIRDRDPARRRARVWGYGRAWWSQARTVVLMQVGYPMSTAHRVAPRRSLAAAAACYVVRLGREAGQEVCKSAPEGEEVMEGYRISERLLGGRYVCHNVTSTTMLLCYLRNVIAARLVPVV
jgi:hypothetical protein